LAVEFCRNIFTNEKAKGKNKNSKRGLKGQVFLGGLLIMDYRLWGVVMAG